ncbi:MAG: hypothetical protein KIY12_05865 [Thermoplasmata archaeon]|uniref:Uncharacterized protein n=1 Tax=Candidatus Sysuiplasma superficiale TaxID=2823368 RepID=A0A8J8CE36_9ARCH|nr:hypothetical protein [Candidatus Sysuiplasma superficiale]MBX8644232.1 hypothetical protein [Candidatus Sysuiplasma superficiale]
MAKKKKVEEEEFVFKPPEFDEREYIEKDLRDSKILIVTTIFGLIAGILAAAATILLNSALLGFVFIILFLIAVFRLIYPLLKVDVSKFRRTDFIYRGGTIIVTALAIWILLVNPPFYVMSPPSLHDFAIAEKTTSGWQSYSLSNSTVIPAGTLNISAVVLHQGEVTVWIYLTNATGTGRYEMNYAGDSVYSFIHYFAAGAYSFVIVAELSNGVSAKSQSFPFTVS